MLIYKISDYLLFRKYITPYILQFLFWSGLAGILYGTWWLYIHDNWAWIMAIVFGTLVTRLIVENLILRFESYHLLKKIQEKLDD